MPFKKEIIYPIFLECCQYADDSFWENIFEELAYGKCPYGTYISKNFICCGYKNKEFSYKIERKDPKVLYDDLYKLFTDKLGILSLKEKVQKKLVFSELEKNIKDSRQEWNNIRKKNIKDIMYEKFVIDMKNKYYLSTKQSKNLLGIIMISILFKTISSKDIVYKDDKIVSINGIEFEKNKVIFSKTFYVNNDVIDNTDENIFENFNLLSTYWSKYLKTLKDINL